MHPLSPETAIVLFDTAQSRSRFYPLSLTRPLGNLWHGMMTIGHWWHLKTGLPVYYVSEPFLQCEPPVGKRFICVDPEVLADDDCCRQLLALETGEMAEDDYGIIGYATEHLPAFNQLPLWLGKSFHVPAQKRMTHASDLWKSNEAILNIHFEKFFSGKEASFVSSSNRVLGNHFFAGDHLQMECCTVNTISGPVYIGNNVLIMEGAAIRGPVFIGDGAVVKMGAKIYGGSSVGPGCVVGGEIKNSILFPNSNKAHDGYLGDSVIGSWCNLGAGTSNSNLKNTAGPVKIWDESAQDWLVAGIKAGTIMGDFSRTAINTSLNTGTTVGICCSIHGDLFPPKHIPSFTWGPGENYELTKALKDAGHWKALKHQNLSAQETQMLEYIYHHKRV